MASSLARSVALLPVLFCAAGCATYTEMTEEARSTYYQKDFELSISLWSELLADAEGGSDEPLLLLERGMAHLATGQYEAAIRDLKAGDERLEVLDFSGNPGEVGKYMFSEDSGLYRGPPHEKILAPTLMSLSFAALQDEDNARTAANAAYSQMERFARLDARAEYGSPLAYIMLGLGAESLGNTQRAYTAFARAYELREIRALQPVLLRLLETNSRQFGGHWVQDYERARQKWGEAHQLQDDEGELVVFVLSGRAPIRVGTLVELNANQRAYLTQQGMSSYRADNPGGDMQAAQAQFNRQSDLPLAVLQPRPSLYRGGYVRMQDGSSLALQRVLDIERHVRRWDDVTKDARMTAALSRMAVRMAVRIATYIAVRNQTDDGLVAFFAALAAGQIMEAADTPDTRCWTLLPRDVWFQRQTLPIGTHQVDIELSAGPAGAQDRLTHSVEISPGKTSYVVLTVTD